LARLWAVLGVLALVELVAVGVAFLRKGHSTPSSPDKNKWVECGHIDDYLPGTVTAFVRGRFYLARLEDGGVLALSRKCTHLGCTVPWIAEEQRFACPCHASAFDITGEVISAPAPRALDLFPVAIENGIVRVDTHQPVRRSAYHKEQLVYSESL
jgi:cytochrome b6-f complex iron-sulfur subunit